MQKLVKLVKRAHNPEQQLRQLVLHKFPLFQCPTKLVYRNCPAVIKKVAYKE